MLGLIWIQTVSLLIVFLKEFLEKVDFEKKLADDKHVWVVTQHAKSIVVHALLWKGIHDEPCFSFLKTNRLVDSIQNFEHEYNYKKRS